MKPLLAIVFALLVSHHVAAQTPVTVYLQWDPPAPTEAVLSYKLYLDTAPAVSVPTTVTSACSCIRTSIAVAQGPHTVKVTGVYLVLAGDPTSQSETAPATVTFTINPGNQVKNIKVVSK